MTISTYTELKAEVTSFSHRTDLASKMDTFTLLAESVINKDLRCVEMETSYDFSLVSNNFATPSDYMEMRYMMYDTTNHIENLPLDILHGRYETTSGNPRGYSIAGDFIHIRPGGSPTDIISMTMIYFKRLTTLTTTSTNDILAAYPMIYLSAMMAQVYLYLQDDTELSKWSSILDNQIKAANKGSTRTVRPRVRAA